MVNKTANPAQEAADLVKSRVANGGDQAIKAVTSNSGLGSLDSSIGSSFYGINHRQTPSAIQINKDYFGLTFFTRPKLNLSSVNLRQDRRMVQLLNTDDYSVQRAIRCTLDPSLSEMDGINTPLIDDRQAFIPLLTNHLLSISGWPDVVAPTATSHEGGYKEAFSFVDGITTNYSTYDIQAQFRNLPGDPITALFLTWCNYASLVYEGIMNPYLQAIIENEIDYQTRIYRLVLDTSKTRVVKIAACGAAFPLSSPIGAAFNYEAGRPINNANDQISIPFRAMGAMYQDDILIYEFNRTVATFNNSMSEKNFVRPGDNGDYQNIVGLQKVPSAYLNIANNRGYPRINPKNYELEWWLTSEDLEEILPMVTQKDNGL